MKTVPYNPASGATYPSRRKLAPAANYYHSANGWQLHSTLAVDFLSSWRPWRALREKVLLKPPTRRCPLRGTYLKVALDSPQMRKLRKRPYGTAKIQFKRSKSALEWRTSFSPFEVFLQDRARQRAAPAEITKRTYQSDVDTHFPSYLHKHTISTHIQANPSPPAACIIGER
jgi:hypothetical protein